jgi:hypothetical protein
MTLQLHNSEGKPVPAEHLSQFEAAAFHLLFGSFDNIRCKRLQSWREVAK